MNPEWIAARATDKRIREVFKVRWPDEKDVRIAILTREGALVVLVETCIDVSSAVRAELDDVPVIFGQYQKMDNQVVDLGMSREFKTRRRRCVIS